ncbi:uncharacterized protein LOC129328491 isoform X2 [Eublepharis macularius]|uniref:Uncharacterized protein LOC129328491 isoform X2 n=1 Tax=Eublepharis macularius TaxID=481883 RepID=A0AA97KW54_EUBMA|nr:uncharacterized protein LOC129328491 isoform X2 [Eublepharis macularius]XP_054833571.1 uncharacterized protein LOC129328491 isoform X2 [Eublepharis macularius]
MSLTFAEQQAAYLPCTKGNKRKKVNGHCPGKHLLRQLQGNSNRLDVISKFVETHKDEEITFTVKQRFKLRICGLDGTFYARNQHMMGYWQNLYLPTPTKMAVFGIVEDVPCLAPAQQLVILVAEDEKVYAYEEEEMHKVGDSVREFLNEGLRLFRQSVSYQCGDGVELGSEDELETDQKSQESIKEPWNSTE